MKIFKKKNLITIFSMALVFLLAFQIWKSYSFLEVNEFVLNSEKLEQSVRLVVIADLHDATFGKDNSKLVEKITNISPDLIIMDGDMINSYSDDCNNLVSSIKELASNYLVYYALGNHENIYIKSHPKFCEEIQAAGATILDKNFVDIAIHNQNIRIGGLYDYAFALDDNNSVNPANMNQEVYKFLMEFENTEAFKIMLSHRPDSFIFGEAPYAWNIDLVISGHVHGGQIVLPYLGGLWAPDQGWFPKYVYGMYQVGKINLFITAGLGSQREALPRFNNPPEIAVLEICP